MFARRLMLLSGSRQWQVNPGAGRVQDMACHACLPYSVSLHVREQQADAVSRPQLQMCKHGAIARCLEPSRQFTRWRQRENLPHISLASCRQQRKLHQTQLFEQGLANVTCKRRVMMRAGMPAHMCTHTHRNTTQTFTLCTGCLRHDQSRVRPLHGRLDPKERAPIR